MFKYVLFDLDGTLTDSSEGITKSVGYALSQNGVTEDDPKALLRFIGPPLTDSFMEYYGFSEAGAQDCLASFRERYEPIGVFENKLYPGIDTLLATLHDKGCRLLVASSKPEYLVYQVLSHFKIKDYFDVIAGSPEDERNYSKEDVLETALFELMGVLDGKPVDVSGSKEVFTPSSMRVNCDLEEALDAHGIDKTTCAMVGDRHFDIRAAVEYGVCAVGVDYGFAEEGEFEAAGADMIARDSDELLSVLLGESKGREKLQLPLKKN